MLDGEPEDDDVGAEGCLIDGAGAELSDRQFTRLGLVWGCIRLGQGSR